MAILNILEFPDPRLRTIAKPVEVVDDAVRQLIDDMFETMYEAPGIGLAATQVNVHKRIVVMDLSEDKSEPRVFINPEFEPLTEEMDQYQEGCLSVPGFYENVDRPQKVRIKALDRDGNPSRRSPKAAGGMHPARMRPPQRQAVRRLPVHPQARPHPQEAGKAASTAGVTPSPKACPGKPFLLASPHEPSIAHRLRRNPGIRRRASQGPARHPTSDRRRLHPARPAGRPRAETDAQRGEEPGPGAWPTGHAAAEPAQCRGPGGAGAARGPDGGGRLWPDPAPGGTRYPAPGLHQQPRLAAAALAAPRRSSARWKPATRRAASP